MKWIISLLFILTASPLFSQTDYWSYLVYFSGCPVNHIPKGIAVPDRDPGSRAIINAIIDGYTYSQLLQKYPDSLDYRLDQLINGKVIEAENDAYKLLFPVFTGTKREELQKEIQSRLSSSNITLDTLVSQLNKAFTGNPDMVFHFLWSRIMDDSWWNLYNSIFNTETGPPSIAFIVYPPHPFQCGTNSDYSPGNDMYAMTWSYNLFDEFFSVPPTASFFSLAEGQPVSTSDEAFFVKYGLADSEGHSLIFTYTVNDSLDLICDKLKINYINLISGLFDYGELSRTFGVPADDLFIVVSHELAYELIGELYNGRSVYVPIMLKDNPERNFRNLISIRYED